MPLLTRIAALLAPALASALAGGLLLTPSPALAADRCDDQRSIVSLPRSIGADRFHTYRGAQGPLEDLPRGTVLKSRTLAYSLGGLPLPVEVEQILYRSNDARGCATANATSVLKPPLPLNPDRVVAYQSFYDSLDPTHGPSYTFAGSTDPGAQVANVELTQIAAFLTAGYTVVVADTQGPTADFAAGPEYGRTTLDSLRAAIRHPGAGIPRRPDIGLYGYSGGAIGTAWAASLAPRYAPAIDRLLVGAANGGVLVFPHHNLGYVLGSKIWAGVAPMALIGVSRAYDIDLAPYLNRQGKRLVRQMRDDSIAEVLGAYPGLRKKDFLKKRFRDIRTIRPYVRTVNKLNLGRRPVPTTPVFLGQGANGTLEGTRNDQPVGAGDGVMIAGDVRALARRWCRLGNDQVVHRQYDLTSHFTTIAAWQPDATAWLLGQFEGVSRPSSCGAIAPGNGLAPVRAR
ncbi:lipase family protein [Nocardioidaceae bacterium]|nr:lipase family protein [Nocardioidaceae bacterium]